MNGRELLEKALEKVESESIRAWARTPKNFPLWLKAAWSACDNTNGNPDVDRFAAYIVAVAIGL